MPGLYLNSGIGASVFAPGGMGGDGGGMFGSGASAMTPNQAPGSPQGPRTVGQRAFGVTAAPAAGPKTAGVGLITTGTVSLGLLIFIYWALPR